MRIRLERLAAAGIVCVGAVGVAWGFTVPNTFQNGQVADASQVNANFAAVASAISTIEDNREGAYNNRVPDLPAGLIDSAYNEVCFTTTAGVKIDNDAAFQGTSGGNCGPGDRGFVFFPQEVSARNWSEAVFWCTTQSARLPSLFEYQMACDALPTGAGLVNNWEWTSNPPQFVNYGTGNAFYGVPILGGDESSPCRSADVGIANGVPATGQSNWGSYAFHCIR